MAIYYVVSNQTEEEYEEKKKAKKVDGLTWKTAFMTILDALEVADGKDTVLCKHPHNPMPWPFN